MGMWADVFNVYKSNIFFKTVTYHKGYYFEIKPIVKSIGEVLRQLQRYCLSLDRLPRSDIDCPRSTAHCSTQQKRYCVILVTKTKGLKDIFKSQGFYVYEYQDEQQTLGGVNV